MLEDVKIGLRNATPVVCGPCLGYKEERAADMVEESIAPRAEN